ncbi:hypothetical protein FH965_19370 [Streptomyces spectabilis]|uniref:Uncharacterized protein n=2 Tax=Streptomyces spectabilis TaxID=68270 RepID=A0A516R9V6_STRST|nr:hypothetical protein FH965_19370 [Streptomyces spectabilis]
MSTAVDLAGDDATTEDVAQFAHCELDEHIEGEHAAHVLFTEDETGRAVWAFWREAESRVQLVDPCPDRNESENICLLFAKHPGGHLWPEDATSLTEQGGSDPCRA